MHLEVHHETKDKSKSIGIRFAALLAASNVIPAVAAYGAPGRSTWQGNLNLDSSIMNRTMLTGKVGTGSEAEAPTESAEPSAPAESEELTESMEAIDETLMLVRAGTFMITGEAELESFFSGPHFRAAVFKAVKDGGDGAAGATADPSDGDIKT